ncbi:MAG: hypothetical protein U0W40_12710 [Acidimicrobiia bacterium]
MSREELVEGYTSGRVSRRVFVKGLVALGVTGTAAVAYANALGAAPTFTPRQAVADLYDLYPPEPPAQDPTNVAGAGAAAPVAAAPAFTG